MAGPGSPGKSGPHQDHHSGIKAVIICLAHIRLQVHTPATQTHKVGNSDYLNRLPARVGISRALLEQELLGILSPKKIRIPPK